MADVTVEQFAEVLKVPVEKLLAQLDEAGIKVSGSGDKISDDAKLELLTHLRRSHGQSDSPSTVATPRRITLKRKSHSELRLSGAQGRSRTVAPGDFAGIARASLSTGSRSHLLLSIARTCFGVDLFADAVRSCKALLQVLLVHGRRGCDSAGIIRVNRRPAPVSGRASVRAAHA